MVETFEQVSFPGLLSKRFPYSETSMQESQEVRVNKRKHSIDFSVTKEAQDSNFFVKE